MDERKAFHQRRASHASRVRWSRVDNRSAATLPARTASHVTRWEKLVDPNNILDAAERAARVKQARKEHFHKLGRKSGEVRRAKAEARRLAAQGNDTVTGDAA